MKGKEMRAEHQTVWLLLLIVAGSGIVNSQTNQPERNRLKPASEIVFVCEHGAALSVVSAAYFNKLTKEQHLPLHALARGTDPQRELAVSARDGLNSDRVPFETIRPQKLSPDDAKHARRIITFVSLPVEYSALAPIEMWNDVPPTANGYSRARDAILVHLRKLLRELQSDEENKR